MKTIIQRANERGHADHGWLNAHHSFSFASWYDPAKVHFGMLRVLNDDIVAGGQGFGTHPHNDMEIITIILKGQLEHRDNMGNGSVIKRGDVQVMSAGTGVMHSEFNPSKDEEVNLFQLWIFPKEQGIKPRYDQKNFGFDGSVKGITTVASGFKRNGELYIHQNAAISVAEIGKNESVEYPVSKEGNGSYVMVIEGSVEINGELLSKRDAIGITEIEKFQIKSNDGAEVLIIDVPMQ